MLFQLSLPGAPKGWRSRIIESALRPLPHAIWLTAVIMILAALGGCAGHSSYKLAPLDIPSALADVKTKSDGNVTVSVAILSDEEAMAHFGLPLGSENVQAIWLQLENASAEHLWFIRNALDPDIFSPDEVAHMAGGSLRTEDYDRARHHLRDESINVSILPGTINQGFIFAPKAIGGRYIDVRLVQDAYELQTARNGAIALGEVAPKVDIFDLRFGFAVPLPDGIFDYEKLDPKKTYAGMELPNLSRQEFRERLEALPCCASNKDEAGEGDPLNVVIVANSSQILNSLSRSGWSFTHRITLASVAKLTGAALQGKSYPVAPVSDLYLFGRKQDFALQRARANIAQRNHMRVWLAPFRFRDTPVWIGQVSRDIGIKLTLKSPSMTTHIIDPEVDLTREYLLHSLLADGLIEAFGFAQGSRAASAADPAVNLADDPYFSDGLRLVLVLASDPIPYTEIESLMWEQVQGPVAEGRSQTGVVNQ
jgi:hypothetical protein